MVNEPCMTRLRALTGIQAILLTSATAIPMLTPNLRPVPVLAVGDATAAKAREAGFTNVVSAAGNARVLVALASATCDPGRGSLLLPGAAETAYDMVTPLRGMGFRVLRRIVYRSRAVPALPAAADAALRARTVTHALFYSPASASAFIRLSRGFTLGTIEALAISPAVASVLGARRWQRIWVARQPTQDALLELLPCQTPTTD